MSAQPPSSSRPSASHRPTSLQKRTSALPKPTSLFLDPTVLVAQHAQFTGTHPITVGPNTVLHPHVKISSVVAPVVIGEGVVVYEKAKIGVGIGGTSAPESAGAGGAMESTRGDGTVLGQGVVVESNAVVEAAEVGEGTVVEVGAVLGVGCVIGKYCNICPMTVLAPNTHIPDFTVVYGAGEKRTNLTLQSRPEILQAKAMTHRKQIDMFKRLMPNNIAKWT
ncbi:trimeric LpxA-like protein [Sporormia fimetaria CBS 119925]|uniref:Dynactin subunit 6 n=1 Tax=Sporormia fimetaria CBS 119925 TaxID=1340428 RepID=A0A6A6VGG2_9PLEO|nr:trimeric LpxA-like protein [Sporormia fimetaria CBS 119925]